MLAPGEILAVDDFNVVAANDGEMGLYSTNGFANSNNIVDYVEWGSSGHQRSSVAVAAGIWTAGDYAPAFGAGESLAYDGEGDSSTDWAAGAPTVCAENTSMSGCMADGGDITLNDGTIETSICVDGILTH